MATRYLAVIAALVAGAQALWDPAGNEFGMSLSDAVCRLSDIMDLGADCNSIVEHQQSGSTRVTFDISGQQAEMVLKEGCRAVADAYVKFQMIRQPEYQPEKYKERVIDFFKHPEWVEQAQSSRCTMLSFSIPETEHTNLMRVNCTKGSDCIKLSVSHDGLWTEEISGTEVHTTLGGQEIGITVESLTESFDFRTASIQEGHDPTFRAIDLPGGGNSADLVNLLMPQFMSQRLDDMRALLIQGEPNPDDVALWPMIAAQYGPFSEESSFYQLTGGESFVDRTCSICPVMRPVCDTMSMATKDGDLIMKFKSDLSMPHESELHFTAGCGDVFKRLWMIAKEVKTLKGLVDKIYGTPELLKMISSGQCSLKSYLYPHSLYFMKGVCKGASNSTFGTGPEADSCWKVSIAKDGETMIDLKNFAIEFPLFSKEDHPDADHGVTKATSAASVFIEHQMVKFNALGARLEASEGDTRVVVNADMNTPVWNEHSHMRKVILAKAEATMEHCARSFLHYLARYTGYGNEEGATDNYSSHGTTSNLRRVSGLLF